MQEELRRSNTIGDSRGILYFAGIILKDEMILRDSARQICSFVEGIRIDFNAAVAFFEYLGFVKPDESALRPTEEGKKLYSLLNGGFEEALCEACLNKITLDAIIDVNALRFDTIKGKYYFQRYGFPISAAVFRNILIQFNALIDRHDGTGALDLSERYEAIFARMQKTEKRRMSIDKLKKQLEQQELQGEAAEEYVVKYEKERLYGTKYSEKVKRISDIDVSAGFDIVSLQTVTSAEYDRFIEVKSYAGQPHFYWSKNEMEVATLYGDKYYLYLVNIEKIGNSVYEPTIIQNPAKSVIESADWLMQPTSYLVIPTNVH